MISKSIHPNLLLVDDKPENLFALRELLTDDHEYNYFEATSGAEALKIAINEPIDLILLDVEMPGMDGYEVASFLNQNKKTKNIPIIFITAINKEDSQILKGYDHGGIEYLFKPLNTSITRAKVQSILKMRRLQRELEESTLELKKSNENLETFAYTVAHDLNSPLNSIAGFINVLEHELEGKIAPSQKDYFHYVLEGVDRMKSLITNLLEYSKIDSQAGDFKEVNTMEVINTVIKNLNLTNKEDEINIIYPPLPNVYGNETFIVQLFQNLINNAIKFCAERPIIIKIDAVRKAEEVLFSVKDNGIGISKNNYKKIFQIFHRLHPTSQFEGTGLGLSICKKIVEQHGGIIWVESELGKGSTFFFTIKNKAVI